MFDFNKPNIEITDVSDDKKYGRFVVEPERLRNDTWKLPEKNHAFFSSGSCHQFCED